LGAPAVQAQLDASLVGQWVSVYALPTTRVRLDSTSVSVYHEPTAVESLLQRGHSKDHRPDLRQFKAMLASLDPLGMPLCSQMIAGHRADDGLYVPCYEAAVEVLGTRDVLVVGDSKMSALTTRGHLALHHSAYLCAFHPADVQEAAWIESALEHAADWQAYESVDPRTGEREVQADIWSFCREQTWTDAATQQTHTWSERVLVVRSRHVQAGLTRRLQSKLERVCVALEALRAPIKRGRRRYNEREPLEALVRAIVAKADLVGVVGVALSEETLADGSCRWIVGSYWVDWRAWQVRVERLGWQFYLSNTCAVQYSDVQLVEHYRHQSIQEGGFARLKTRNLQIRPVYLRDETRLSGLLWLLCLALRVLTLVEYRVREALAREQTALVGLNPAAPRQANTHPSTERLIKAFDNITLTCIGHGEQTHRHVPPLTPLQQQILEALRLPADLYQRVAAATPNCTINLRE
jgi:hypothetical protein